MDLQAICNEFAQLDDEVKQEFYSDVRDCVQDLNECLEILDSEDSRDLVNRMFRSIHTIKGNCNMVFLQPYVDATHLIEEMVQDVRNQAYDYQSCYGRLFITAINAIAEKLADTMSHNEIDGDYLERISRLIAMVRESAPDRRVDDAKRAELAIHDGHLSLNLVAVSHLEDETFSIFNATDMEFFKYLSDCQLAVDPDHQIKMKVLRKLVGLLNSHLAKPEDEEQLLAACYVFEFCRIIRGNDQDQIRRRVFSAGSMLSRIPGWQRAAELVFQSYEELDGGGFPRGLTEAQIEPAAKILHLADYFISFALQNKSKGYKQSLFLAVKAANQLAGKEYPPKLIASFNQIIKTDFLCHIYW